MKEVKLVEASIANGFEVKQVDSLDVYYRGKFIMTIGESTVIKTDYNFDALPDIKQGQLLYLIKKYQDLSKYEAVVEF